LATWALILTRTVFMQPSLNHPKS